MDCTLVAFLFNIKLKVLLGLFDGNIFKTFQGAGLHFNSSKNKTRIEPNRKTKADRDFMSSSHSLNDIIRWALTTSGLPSILEPVGLGRVGRRDPNYIHRRP